MCATLIILTYNFYFCYCFWTSKRLHIRWWSNTSAIPYKILFSIWVNKSRFSIVLGQSAWASPIMRHILYGIRNSTICISIPWNKMIEYKPTLIWIAYYNLLWSRKPSCTCKCASFITYTFAKWQNNKS